VDRTADGKPLRMLAILDEYTRECLAIEVARWLNSQSVLALLAELFLTRGVPEHIRSDNGPEFDPCPITQLRADRLGASWTPPWATTSPQTRCPGNRGRLRRT
jgi:hypothetical protein